MWVDGGSGILLIKAIQGCRLTEKPTFYDITFSSTGFWVCHGKGREQGADP